MARKWPASGPQVGFRGFTKKGFPTPLRSCRQRCAPSVLGWAGSGIRDGVAHPWIPHHVAKASVCDCPRAPMHSHGHAWLAMHSSGHAWRTPLHACMRACMGSHACVHACMGSHACMHACMAFQMGLFPSRGREIVPSGNARVPPCVSKWD